MKTNIGDSAEMRFEVNYKTKDKMDFSIALNDSNVGVSAKAVDL
jgi:hypothetical protein